MNTNQVNPSIPASRLVTAYRDAYVELRLEHLRSCLRGEQACARAYGALVVKADELGRLLPSWLRAQIEEAIDAAFPEAA